MDEKRVIEVKQEILSANTAMADEFRAARSAEGTMMTDIMGSPGAGKTTFLLALIERLRKIDEGAEHGVIEADIDSKVDSVKMKENGVTAVQLETRGVCHVEMGMVNAAYAAFGDRRFGYMFLENIGNLVCPAEFDTGAHARVLLLSVPEGYDKVYKYPIIFGMADALVVTKCDYLPLNPDFDMAALHERARALNPGLKIFEVSARTGEGMDEVAEWFKARRAEAIAPKAF